MDGENTIKGLSFLS